MPNLSKGARPIKNSAIYQHYIDYQHQAVDLDCYTKSWKQWLTTSDNKTISGIDEFEFADFVNGTAQAFDHFVLRNQERRIVALAGEFQYHRCISRRGRFSTISSDDLKTNDALLISLPFSDTGNKHVNFENILKKCNQQGIPVCLDLAYWGIGRDIEINLNDYPCVKEFTCSLSKPFYVLETHRIGIRFSRDYPNDGISMLNEVGMANIHSMGLGKHFLDQFSADWNWNQHQQKYTEICQQLKLTGTNTIIFALGNTHDHSDFNRGVAGQHRLCVSEYLNDL